MAELLPYQRSGKWGAHLKDGGRVVLSRPAVHDTAEAASADLVTVIDLGHDTAHPVDDYGDYSDGF
jgi:hypothetical protein